jgi:outer membrane protein TolC
MQKNKKALLYLVAVSYCSITLAQTTSKKLSDHSYIQEQSTEQIKDKYKQVNLNDIIEQGSRKNYDQQLREMQTEVLDIDWKDAKEEFWLPSVDLSLITAEHKVSTLKSGSYGSSSTSTSPTGTLGLNFGDYTVFNWGKDYLQHLNTKANYLRNKDILSENKRELKQNLILKYFELSKVQKIENIYKIKLRHASFIYRLNKEKVALKKVSKQEYYQARSEYLIAQSDYYLAKENTASVEEELSTLINDPVGTRYIIRQDLQYKTLQTSLEEVIRLSDTNNPNILTAKTNVENANRDYELNLKENLPLPKFTVNLGAYNHQFAENINRTRYENESGSSNVEIVATINATWSITGTGGLLNGRKNRRSLVNKHLALKTKSKAQRHAHGELRSLYRSIKILQNQMTILEASIPTLQKSFDTIMQNYIDRRTSYINFHSALENLIEAEVLSENTIYNHLSSKIIMAQTVGIENFPGETFEKLAIKKGEK